MRGVDYRSGDGSGISLLLARDLPNQRAYVQALGRVGRYAETCKRFAQEGIQLVNNKDEIKNLHKIKDAVAKKNEK